MENSKKIHTFALVQVLVSIVIESMQAIIGSFAQVLEWYTSTLEVRMSQDVGVRVSSWVQRPLNFSGFF